MILNSTYFVFFVIFLEIGEALLEKNAKLNTDNQALRIEVADLVHFFFFFVQEEFLYVVRVQSNKTIEA